MFLVEGKLNRDTYLSSTDMKEKSTARISTGNVWLFILLGQLLLLLFTGTSFAAKLLVAFNTVESSCRKDPLGNVNISLASPWLKNPVGICSMLSWRNVLRIHNTSQFSARMNCSELDGAFDSLSKVSTAFNEFSSAVESFDCSQRYSVKKNCSQCLVSMITSNLATATQPEMKILVFL